MRTAQLAFIGTLPFLLVGCVDDSKTAALGQQVALLEAKVTDLENKLGHVERSAEAARISATTPKHAWLSPGSEGYSTVGFDLGTLTVAVTNVVPYANGSKVTLQFGNPLGASIDGLNMEIEWGEVGKYGLPKSETLQKKKHRLAESLPPNKWTSTTVVLPNSPPEKLGVVIIQGVSHTGISLRR